MKWTTKGRPGVVDRQSYQDEVRKTIACKGDIVKLITRPGKKYRVNEAGMKILRLENVDDPSDKMSVYRSDCIKDL